ncbi:MAG TPA: polymer-forming cytoskeletal protein [Candidatus Binatia bacterium]|nr:polymer-forming cytoskeletal protein [Candidatus Binatia bacterium]
MAQGKVPNGGGGGAWQDVRVSLGPDAEVTGKLAFVSPTRIEGKLKGEVRASELLVIGPEAVVQATVRAEKLVVLGEVRGEVQGASRVEICSGGRLFGDVETRCLVIEEGGTFEGHSRMGERAAASPPAAAPAAPEKVG